MFGIASSASTIGHRVAAAGEATEDGVQQTGQKLLTVLRKQEAIADVVVGPLERALADISDNAGTRSPQLQTLHWLAETSTHNANSDGRNTPDDADAALIQMYSLGVLYFATNGDNWKECSRIESKTCESDGPQSSSRFLSDGFVCDWFGLTCSDEGKKGLVTWIDLSHNNLEGSIPDELSLLNDNLELLWLSGNAIGGTLPAWIGKATNLQSLSLFDTSLSGTIPDSIYGLSKLWSLRLYGSQFQGPISTKIGNLSKLQWLWIHGNHFTGSIPSELGSLKDLEALTVHGNDFRVDDKEVPSEVCDLRTKGKKLEHLWVDCNADKACRCCTRCWPTEEDKLKLNTRDG